MTCPVCLQQCDQPASLDPCGHTMCKTCADQWVETCRPGPATCPVCRASIARLTNPEELARSKTALSRNISQFHEWCASEQGPDSKQHQIEGVTWCLKHEVHPPPQFANVCGGLICDEMGLGKTILSLGLIISNFKTRTLVVLPPVLIPQWVDALRRFCGHTPLVFHGPTRHAISKDDLEHAPIVLTSYHMLAAPFKKRRHPTSQEPGSEPGSEPETKILTPLHALEWDRVILDEAHHLRNQNTLFRGVQALRYAIIWMVTGTPVHNKEKDLDAYWLLLGLPRNTISQLYTSARSTLRLLIRQHVLRRTKDEVGIHLPDLTQEVVEVQWQDEFERDFAEQLHSQLAFSGHVRNRVSGATSFLTSNTLPALVRCRQACVRPALMDPHIQFYKDYTGDLEIEQAPSTSAKLAAVVDTVVRRRHCGRKLIFCTYHGEIDLLARLLTNHGFSVRSIDGRVPTPTRMQYINHDLPDVLLTQIISGSEGLNLQKYSDLYVVSPHWNPSIDDQAIARAHRIGQSLHVHVSRFIISHHLTSIDAYAQRIQLRKRRLRPF